MRKAGRIRGIVLKGKRASGHCLHSITAKAKNKYGKLCLNPRIRGLHRFHEPGGGRVPWSASVRGDGQPQHSQRDPGPGVVGEAPLVSFRYTPTYASWVTLAECFFSILTRKGLQQSVHRSNRELVRFLKEFVKQYNKTCGAYIWTKGPKKLKRIIELTKAYQVSLHTH